MTAKRDRLALAFGERLARLHDDLGRELAGEGAARPILPAEHPESSRFPLLPALRAGDPGHTVQEALAAVTRGAAGLARSMAAQLRGGARLLLRPVPAEAALAACVAAWPWPLWDDPAGAGLPLARLLLRLQMTGRTLPAGEVGPGDWVTGVVLDEVAEWVQLRLTRAAQETETAPAAEGAREEPPGTAAFDLPRTLARRVREGGPAHLFLPRDVFPGTPDLSGRALAGLYRLAQELDGYRPRAPTMGLVSVERVPVRTLTALAGCDPRAKDREGSVLERPSGDGLVALEFRWSDGSSLCPQLDFTPGAPAMTAIASRYGDGAVRDLLAIYFLTWAARARADQAVWLWPEELLEIVGLAQSKENRARLRRMIDDLSRSRLTARYETGAPLVGPILTVGASDGEAMQIHLHPALYRGITHEDGTPGNYWWPWPLELLRLPAHHTTSKVHVLLPVLGSMFRARQGQPVDVGLARLTDLLGIRGQAAENRVRNPEAAETLVRTLNAAHAAGALGPWQHSGGDLDTLSGTLHLVPSDLAVAVWSGQAAVQRPAWLPATGDDLERWLQTNGHSAAEAAKILDLPARTLQRAATYGPRPLPASIRRAFRTHLWPPGRSREVASPAAPPAGGGAASGERPSPVGPPLGEPRGPEGE